MTNRLRKFFAKQRARRKGAAPRPFAPLPPLRPGHRYAMVGRLNPDGELIHVELYPDTKRPGRWTLLMTFEEPELGEDDKPTGKIKTWEMGNTGLPTKFVPRALALINFTPEPAIWVEGPIGNE